MSYVMIITGNDGTQTVEGPFRDSQIAQDHADQAMKIADVHAQVTPLERPVKRVRVRRRGPRIASER